MDRARLADMLPRLCGPDAAARITLTDRAPAGGVDFSAAPGARILTDWTQCKPGSVPILCHTAGVEGGALIEQIGPDPAGRVAELAAYLDAELICLPAGTIPLSARLHAALGRAMEEALLAWGTPLELDEACVEIGFALGPFALQDRVGLDDLLAARRVVEAAMGLSPLPLFPRAVGEGRLGRKASVGWHRYPGQGHAVEDPLVEDMAEEEARFAGIARVPEDATVIARRIAARLDECARALVAEVHGTPEQICRVAEYAIGYAPRL